jgi:hypothetical protein
VRIYTYKFKATFPEQLIRNVVQVYDVIFECSLLKNELTVLYSSEVFQGKSPYEILQWFHSNSMATTFEETYKVANLVSSIPATMAAVERRFSAPRKIKVRKD